DVVLEPLAEAPRADLGRMPIDLGVDLEHPAFHGGRAHEPGAAGVVDQRRVATPAMGVAVRIWFGLEPTPLVLEALDDHPVRFLVGDELAFDLGPARAAEGAVERDRVHEGEPVLLAYLIVVCAVS